MLTPSPACAALIKRFEGCVLKAYPDPGSGGDPWTIGIGHTGPEIHRGLVWTQEQCDAALDTDIRRRAVSLNSLIDPAKTTQAQFDAMLSLIFNIGIGNFLKSSVLANHKVGRFANAAAAFLLWDKASGHVMRGLANRRAAESAHYAGQ
jgi:lysozyme